MCIKCRIHETVIQECTIEQKFYCAGAVVYNGDHADYTNCSEVDVARKNVEKLLWQRKHIVIETE